MDGKYGHIYTEGDVLALLRYVGVGHPVQMLGRFTHDRQAPRSTFPPDEPVFVLRGQDKAARSTVEDYRASCTNLGAIVAHQERVQEAIDQFARFAADHSERMKVGD